MNAMQRTRRVASEMAVAFQFLTRIPMPSISYEADSLSRATKFFPLVGLVVGSGAVLVQKLLMFHMSRPLVAGILLLYLVLITGCLHEDGLADTADGFGGGRTKDQILSIMKDSRIGSYGATALVLSLLTRYLLLASLPLEHFAAYVISSQVLCRWSSLPLSYFLPPAREQDGHGRPSQSKSNYGKAEHRPEDQRSQRRQLGDGRPWLPCWLRFLPLHRAGGCMPERLEE